MVLLRTTQTTRSNDIQLFQTSSNHLVYQDMYTFKNDFYRVQTNVVSVNLWLIILTSGDLANQRQLWCYIVSYHASQVMLCFKREWFEQFLTELDEAFEKIRVLQGGRTILFSWLILQITGKVNRKLTSQKLLPVSFAWRGSYNIG